MPSTELGVTREAAAVGRRRAPPARAAAVAAAVHETAATRESIGGADAGDGIAAREPDAALVARCLRGDAGAWSTLVHRYQRLVYAIARRAGLDEHAAGDVFQTVFARLVEHLGRIGDPARLQAWIVTTAKRETISLLRRGRRHVSMTGASDDGEEGDDWDVADDSPIAEEALEELQQLDRLRTAIDRLDERSRTLILMLFRDEDEKLPYDEVARRLGLPVGSIGPTRARCLEKLRRLMSVS